MNFKTSYLTQAYQTVKFSLALGLPISRFCSVCYQSCQQTLAGALGLVYGFTSNKVSLLSDEFLRLAARN